MCSYSTKIFDESNKGIQFLHIGLVVVTFLAAYSNKNATAENFYPNLCPTPSPMSMLPFPMGGNMTNMTMDSSSSAVCNTEVRPLRSAQLPAPPACAATSGAPPVPHHCAPPYPHAGVHLRPRPRLALHHGHHRRSQPVLHFRGLRRHRPRRGGGQDARLRAARHDPRHRHRDGTLHVHGLRPCAAGAVRDAAEQVWRRGVRLRVGVRPAGHALGALHRGARRHRGHHHLHRDRALRHGARHPGVCARAAGAAMDGRRQQALLDAAVRHHVLRRHRRPLHLLHW